MKWKQNEKEKKHITDNKYKWKQQWP